MHIIGKSCLGLLLLSVLTGCAPPWSFMRTVNKYSKVPSKDPYAYSVSLVGGARIKLNKFYYTKQLACAVLHVDNKRGELKVYVNPNKAQFVSGKVGVWSMKSTVAARDLMYRRMAAHYNKLDAKNVPRWSRYHFPIGTVAPKEERSGLLCFRLGKSDDDPKRILINEPLRMRLTGVLVGGGPARVGWLWLKPM